MTNRTPLPYLSHTLADPASDVDLLARFAATRDADAFAALVRRHGAMVRDVCRSVLRNDADADDALQATFLLLATKHQRIHKPAALAAWLHGVAYRVAQKLRSRRVRQGVVEAKAALREATNADELLWADVQRVLHEELGSLAERYRGPLVLCYLQGLTQDDAATRLQLSKGTLKRRLEQGRALLRDRLVRRGLGSAGAILAAWPAASNAVLPTALLQSVQQNLTTPATTITNLAHGVSTTMTIATWKKVASVFLVGGVLLLGVSVPYLTVTGQPTPPKADPAPKDAPMPKTSTDDLWPEAVSGLQARVVLEEKEKNNGTRMLVPYLELRNVSSSATPLKVSCSTKHVQFELLDVDGKALGWGMELPRSGPHPDPGTVALPFDSTVRINMHCTNWGIPKDATAMISTDSGAWILKDSHRGQVFLRATLRDSNTGSVPLTTPKLAVTWKVVPPIPKDIADPFAEYRDKEPVPDSLRETYYGFVRSAKGGSVMAYLLPQGVKTSTALRPEKTREYGDDINEDFLKNGFHPQVFTVRKEEDGCYLLRTGTTAIWFVQIADGKWKVYRYLDKPIQ